MLFVRIKQIAEWFRKKVSRNKWSLRLLGLPPWDSGDNAPGLVLIQIDGLSMTQFQKALNAGRLPFLEKEIYKGRLDYKPMYSGMPSTTPAFQGELFFGVKTCVPAFEFIDRKQKQRHVCFYPQTANYLAGRLEKMGRPLLVQGHVYATIFSGGAAQARYCFQTMTLESLAQKLNPLKLLALLFLHSGKFLRVLAVAIMEFFLAVTDFFRGIRQGRKFIKELVFIPSRIFICIILRELVRFRVKMDVSRGVPIVYANFLGFDEQAHRRRPDSGFAHWSLKGIDDTIGDICRTSRQSGVRKYETIIFSDHGQQAVVPYEIRYGVSIKAAVRSAFYDMRADAAKGDHADHDTVLDSLYKNARSFLMKKGFWEKQQGKTAPVSGDTMEITTMGPLGHIYLPEPLSGSFIHDFARELVHSVHIPLVLYQHRRAITAITRQGIFDLEQQPDMVLGNDHPFTVQTARDLASVCRHPDAGDIVISGWDTEQTPLSFNVEGGAHGGPGKEETCGIVLLSKDLNTKSVYLRPLDLRHLIQDYRGKAGNDR